MDLARQLAETLRRLRRQAGLTQTEMAKWLGISQPTLNRLESAGQNTTLRTLEHLCRALHCTVGDLFEGEARLRPARRRRRL
jgi:transcriptional regulator with XRE-family HTH domain